VFRSPRFAVRLATLLLLSPLAAGCGPGQGRVSGRVLFGGKPVPGGLVMFLPADGRASAVSAPIDENGNYLPVTLPVGEVMVSVDNRDFAPLPLPAAPPVPKGLLPEARSKMSAGSTTAEYEAVAAKRAARYVSIPTRFYNAETSNIRFTVKPGEQQYDVNLTN